MHHDDLRAVRWSVTGGSIAVQPDTQDAVFRRLGGSVRWGASEEIELVETIGSRTDGMPEASASLMQRMRPCAAPVAGSRFARPVRGLAFEPSGAFSC